MAKAAQAKAGPAERAGGSRSFVWLQGMVCGALLTFATPTALLLGALFAPAVAARLADTQAGRPVARAVAVASLAAGIGPLWRLWLGSGSMATATRLLADPATIGIAWISAASAWAACEILPVLLQATWELRERARLHGLEEELKGHRSTWQLDDP